ncbi:MAG: hypothetical protein AAGM36_16150 [Cyanobacteria bacterium J06597_1]
MPFTFVLIAIAALVLLAVGLSIWAIRTSKKPRIVQPKPMPTADEIWGAPTPVPTGNRFGELVRQVSGDRALAQQLVSQQQKRHPNQTQAWCVDKALMELEQDRR